MRSANIFQQLYDSEINFEVSCFAAAVHHSAAAGGRPDSAADSAFVTPRGCFSFGRADGLSLSRIVWKVT